MAALAQYILSGCNGHYILGRERDFKTIGCLDHDTKYFHVNPAREGGL